MASDLLGNPLVIDTVRRPMFVRIVLTICLFASSSLAFAQQEFRSAGKGASTPLPITGSVVDADHNALDVKCLAGCTGGGGAGDASLAEQQAQTALLTTIDADTGTIAGAVDTTGTDRMRVTMYDSSGAEVVVPTAGLTSYTAAGASTNATNVKNAAGTVYGYTLTNTTTAIYYLRMYNLTTAPTCSSATGYVSTIPIPPASAAGGAGGREIQKNIGQAFTTGIGFCVTGGASSTDNTNAATGVFVEILYK